MSSLTCVCGRVCANIQGLGSHQRACVVHQKNIKKLQLAAQKAKQSQTAPSSPVSPRSLSSPKTPRLNELNTNAKEIIEVIHPPIIEQLIMPLHLRPKTEKVKEMIAGPESLKEVKETKTPEVQSLKPPVELMSLKETLAEFQNSKQLIEPMNLQPPELSIPKETMARSQSLKDIMQEGPNGLQVINGVLMKSSQGFVVLGDPNFTEYIYYVYKNTSFHDKEFLNMPIPQKHPKLETMIRLHKIQERLFEVTNLQKSLTAEYEKTLLEFL